MDHKENLYKAKIVFPLKWIYHRRSKSDPNPFRKIKYLELEANLDILTFTFECSDLYSYFKYISIFYQEVFNI